jgi:hypothetical protein
MGTYNDCPELAFYKDINLKEIVIDKGLDEPKHQGMPFDECCEALINEIVDKPGT